MHVAQPVRDILGDLRGERAESSEGEWRKNPGHGRQWRKNPGHGRQWRKNPGHGRQALSVEKEPRPRQAGQAGAGGSMMR